MKIAFYYSFPLQREWTGRDLEGAGVSGAETALVHLARQFAKRHDVCVFNRAPSPVMDHGVLYRNLNELDPETRWDVLVVMRGPSPDPSLVDARVRVYFSVEEDRSLIKDWDSALEFFNAVFTLSPFHSARLAWRCGVPEGRIYETRLGVDISEYRRTRPKVAGRLIYCSVPGKGLDRLAGIFRRVRARVPWASLFITGDYSLWGKEPSDEGYRALFRDLAGVTYLGKVPRLELVGLQATSVLHVHPCTVDELFCLPSIECQAAAAPSVCSALGSLPTTVEDGRSGVLVQTRPDSLDFEEAFADEIVRLLLGDPGELARMAAYARARALTRFAYEVIASEWEREFEALGAATQTPGPEEGVFR